MLRNLCSCTSIEEAPKPDEPTTDTPTDGLSGSVGKGGAHKKNDVKKVQELLNKKGNRLTVEGKYGNNTLKAIKAFQRSIGSKNDGLIEPNRKTWKALTGS